MNNKKGFTLIELIVILALASIVMLAVMSFFIANYRSYNMLNTESELQYQSQNIINFMTDKILETKEFEGKDADDEYSFINDDGTKLTFKKENGKLVFKEEDEPEVTVGDYIEEFDITSLNDKEVSITLKLEKDNIAVDAEQTVFMRNAQ
jgi:prepilin-type N-terminal cleavage/methylation domain-containing protein